jgi:branched-chain amino acid transport system ATP-binding protein
LWGTFSVATGLAPSAGLLAVARAGAGLGRSATTPTHFSLLADYYPVEIRPKVYGVHRAANSVGQFLGPLLAGVLAFFLGWRAPFLIFALPTAILVVLAMRLREPVRGGYDRLAAGADAETAAVEDEPPSFRDGVKLLWRVRTLRRVWYSLPFVALVVVGLGALFSTFYEQEFGLNSAERGLASAVTEPAQLIGLFFGVPVANRLLKRDPALVLRFIAVVGVIIATCFALLALTPYLAVVIGMHMIISAAAAVLAPGAYSVLSLAMPARARSLGFALSALWFLPGLAMFPLIGQLGDEHGIRPALLALTPMMLIGGFLLASAGKFLNADITRARAQVTPKP